MKKLLCLFAALLFVFSLCGCDFLEDVGDMANNPVASVKTFEFDGLSIDLTTDFLRMDFIDEDFDFVVGDENLSVLGLKIDFDGIELNEYTPLEFATYYRELLLDVSPTEVSDNNGIPCFNYASEVDGESQTIVAMFYKASDCFWIVSFGIATDNYDKYASDIIYYAQTVKCE